jgi:hypothetical protein
MIRRLVTGLVIASVLGGCFYPGAWSKPTHRTAFQIDAGLVAAGLLIAVLPCHDSPDDDIGCHTIFAMMGTTLAAPGAFGALINLMMGDGGPDEAASPPAPSPPPNLSPPSETASTIAVPPHDGVARELAVRAALAARAGDCVSARASMRALFREDAGYYQEVAASDPAIVACVR